MQIRKAITGWAAASALLVGVATAQADQARNRRQNPHPNVILITVDTLRADHVGCYGAKDVQTPVMDSLAHDGLQYDRAISQVPLTWPAHAAILTGTYPFQNGVQDFTSPPLAQQFRSIAQSFQTAGYATGAVVSSFVLDRSFGLARGFDYYDDAFPPSNFQQKEVGLVDRRADDSVNRALGWLGKTSKRPFFFWLHLYDPHSPYDPPEPFRTEYKTHSYDGEIAYTDREIGRLIAWLKTKNLYAGALIVLVSDHGESLGEHGEQEHGFFLYDATIRVPLIVKPPTRAGTRANKISEPVEIVAIGPTLLSLAGIHDSIEKQFQSKSLPDGKTVPNTNGGSASNAMYSETLYPFRSFGWSPLRALQTSRYHYVDAPRPELYDLTVDPGETTNLAAQQPAIVATLREKLKTRLDKNPFHARQPDTHGVTLEGAEKLRSLGYIAYRAPESGQSSGLPDPKDKIAEFNAILQAGDAFRANDFPRGEALLSNVRKQDSNLYVIPYMLGEAALRQGKFEEAKSQLQEAIKLAPEFDQGMMALARALHEQGDDAGAQQWLNEALKRNPQNYRAWYELGSIQRKSDRSEATNSFAKALAIQPNFAIAERDLGMIRFDQKGYSEAAQHLAKAIILGFDDSRTYNYLGICYSRMSQFSKAVASYQKAVQITPDLAEAHLNLAYAYQRLNRSQDAERESQIACRLEQRYCSYLPPK